MLAHGRGFYAEDRGDLGIRFRTRDPEEHLALTPRESAMPARALLSVASNYLQQQTNSSRHVGILSLQIKSRIALPGDE